MRKTVGILMAAAIMTSITGCAGQAGDKTESQTTVVLETEFEVEETSGVAETDGIDGTAGDSGTTDASGVENGQDREHQNVDAKLSEIHQTVKDAYKEAYIPSSPYDDQAMESIFGVGSDLYDSYIAEGPMISAHVETFVGIAAKEGKGEEVEKALNQYRDSLISDTMQYPMNIVKIQASKVVRHGDYVFFVMLGSPDADAEEKGEEEALLSAEANNQTGLDVIDEFFK